VTVRVEGPEQPRQEEVLAAGALDLVADLERRFGTRRRELLARRLERREGFAAGVRPGFLDATRELREGDWTVAPPPADLRDRRVEITGPVDRKMMINAFNSGARVFMADFEDANAPTWQNVVAGQANVADAARGRLEFTAADGREYRLGERTATMMVRPRGWHLVEKHVLVDGRPVSAALFDAGLHLHANARALLAAGTGPYLYLPKLESHLEARLWNDVLRRCEDVLDLPRGSVRATVLVETILAAFEMDEILYELRERSAGLNAGRWDYIFSVIKNFAGDPAFVLPDRIQVTMTVPFMRAYTELLVRTCHRRGAHAIGGMAAFIPNRRDPEVTARALAAVRDDKRREAGDGFDGTWVAHPDLVATAREEFDAVLGARPNQVERDRADVHVTAADLLDVRVPGGTITEAGLRTNVSVGIRYLDAWLGGTGAAAIDNLMEDAATAEISRSQVWQWVHHGRFGASRVQAVVAEEVERIRAAPEVDTARLERARELFERVALAPEYAEFLTVPAYALVE
jgi:malate synthase